MTGYPVIFPDEIREIMNGSLLSRLPINLDQAEIVAGSTLTPLPWVDEMAIFLR